MYFIDSVQSYVSHLCLKLSLKHFIYEWMARPSMFHTNKRQLQFHSNVYFNIWWKLYRKCNTVLFRLFIFVILSICKCLKASICMCVCLCDSIWMIDRIVLFIWFNWRWLLSVAVPIHEGYPLVLSSISTKIPFYRPEISTNHHILIA